MKNQNVMLFCLLPDVNDVNFSAFEHVTSWTFSTQHDIRIDC